MNEARPETPPQDPRVQAVLQDYLERLDRGEDVDCDAFLDQHADVADELRSFISTEEQLRQLAARKSNAPAAELATRSIADREQETIPPQRAAAPGLGSALPEQFGRYRIFKPLGEGAMGIVSRTGYATRTASRTEDAHVRKR